MVSRQEENLNVFWPSNLRCVFPGVVAVALAKVSAGPPCTTNDHSVVLVLELRSLTHKALAMPTF